MGDEIKNQKKESLSVLAASPGIETMIPRREFKEGAD